MDVREKMIELILSTARDTGVAPVDAEQIADAILAEFFVWRRRGDGNQD